MKHSKTSLFLMELIIALLFFSLASTVCIRLFVNARSLSSQTVDTNHAVNYAQNMAEAFIGCDGNMQILQTVMDNSHLSESEDGFILSLEQNGYVTYLVCSGLPEPGTTISADIRVYKPDTDTPRDMLVFPDPLYTLHVDLHIPHVK